jgi:beta-glucuronidase
LLCAPLTRADNIPDLGLRLAASDAGYHGQSLNGEWKYIVDPYETGYYDYRLNPRDQAANPGREAFFMDAQPRDKQELLEYNFDTAQSIQVPGDWNTQKRELYYYEGTVWYRKTFHEASLKKGERAFIQFGAANYRADVYLNGKKLGMHIGGFTPFSFEVTDKLLAGQNSLVVKVDNKRAKEAVPTLNTDWWNYGGITRDVTVVRTPAIFVAEHRLRLESEQTKVISGEVTLNGAGANKKIQLSIPELHKKLELTADASGRASFSFTAENLQLWSPSSPKLYEVNIALGKDVIKDQIGFRTVRTQGKQILLNGKPIFLRGICAHEEFALNGGGRVKTAEEDRQILTWAKELGTNFIRLAHYPHNEAMVREAEKMGFLLWSEIPVYWTIDWTNESTYQNAQNQLSDMIQRDYNRAGVIIWSLANETPVQESRTRFLTRLAEKARAMDSSRLLSAAMEKHYKTGNDNIAVVQDPLADVVDLVAFNQYLGWYDGAPGKIDRIGWEINYNKPVFISEFGGDARYGRHGDAAERWTEEYQADIFTQHGRQDRWPRRILSLDSGGLSLTTPRAARYPG